MAVDLVIRNGTVFDGSGAEPLQADLAVVQGRIADIGRIDAPEVPTIDATGLYVAPGFIDIHSHSDWTLLVDPRAVSAIHQGVTLEVLGNCGYGCFPIGDPRLASKVIYGYSEDLALDWTRTAAYFDRLEAARPAVNVLSLVPNGQLRLATLGFSPRAATPAEVGTMRGLLEQSLDEGAWGYSTGLEYSSESGASEAEITALCRTVARYGGLYATHTRRRDAGAAEAVVEALRTAEQSGVRLQVSHLLPRSGPDECARCIEAVDQARQRGLDVAFDMHTRLFGLTYLPADAAALGMKARKAWASVCNRAAATKIEQYQSILSTSSSSTAPCCWIIRTG
ncbi:MAG: amidohydrolase family protein [Gammaproteobacteria bacterium]